jgi:hypothetical protein
VGFWATVACIPAAWAIYYVARDSDNSQPFLTRMIGGYTESAEKLSKMNDLHTRMIEQAGEDRVLFNNTKPHEHVNMKFPEYVRLLILSQIPASVRLCECELGWKYAVCEGNANVDAGS